MYSSSAIELFWTPTDGLVQINKNGAELGRFDARSLFQASLDSTATYHYELRTVGANGERSAPVIVSLSTRDFSLPIRRIQPIGQTPAGQEEFIAPPPPPVSEALSEATQPSTLSDGVVTQSVAQTRPEEERGATQAPSEQASANDVPVNDETQTDVVQTNNNCIARNLSGLLTCVRNANAYQRIDMAQDITCDGNCCPNGGALLRFDQVKNLAFAGNGHRLLRTVGQRQCSLMDITRSSNLQVSGVRLDDDQRVGGCQVAENCPRMVHIRSSASINFSDTHVSHGKGYAFYVQGTDGFRFERGSLHNSGVLGMYIGHGNDASRNVSITESTFSDNQTNGLALLGVTGQSPSSNIVADNLFVRNHRKGQWQVEPRFGSGFTGGGQLYVAEASNVTVRNNVIRDGYCENCFVQRVNRSGVSGIELGRPNQQSLSNINVVGNTIVNLDGFGISQNANSSLSRNVSITNNVLLNTTSGEHVQGAQKSGNRVLNTQQFDSFESSNDIGARFQGDVSCSATGSVERQCSGDTRFGQCSAKLQLGTSDCSGARASLTGPQTNISAGQVVVASGWVRSAKGRWCAVFRDSSGRTLSEQCKDLSDAGSSDVQSYVGMPTIEATAPGGSSSVQLLVEHRQSGASMWLDDLKLSVGNAP